MPEKSSNRNKSKPKEVKNATGIDVSFGKTTSKENQENTTTDKTFTKSDKVHGDKISMLPESYSSNSMYEIYSNVIFMIKIGYCWK